MGIYSSHYCWPEIVGSGWDVGAEGYPLWYAHYDGVKAFSDWASTEHGGFGGWTKPHTKQYLGTHGSCGVGVDYNFYPSGGDLSWRNATLLAL